MSVFINSIEKLPAYIDVKNAVAENTLPALITGVSGIHKAQFILGLIGVSANSVSLVVTDDEASAKRICDDINEMADNHNSAMVYPAKDFTFTDVASVSREYEHTRLSVLSNVRSGKCKVICASCEAVMQKTIPSQLLYDRTVILEQGSQITTKALAEKLISAGYSRCDKVEGVSQFSIRGSIADIFPVQETNPVRIEFWGDDIDSISYFDVESQRRTQSIDILEISPALEVLFDSTESFIEKITQLCSVQKSKYADKVKENLNNDIDRLKTGVTLGNIDKYLPLAYEKPATIFDYLNKDSIIYFCEYRNIAEKSKAILAQHNEDIKILFEDAQLCKGLDGYLLEINNITAIASKHKQIFMDTFMRGENDLRFKKLISVTANQTAPWGGEIRQLSEDLHSFIDRDYSVIVLAGSEKTLPIIAQDIRDEGIPCNIINDKTEILPRCVYLKTGCVTAGYDYPEIKTAMITQAKAMVSRRKLKKAKKGEEIKSLSDISNGDLVVHALHGIGRFIGIRKLEMEGVTKDYITIQYAGTDVLYVPVTQLDLVSKYIGPRDNSGVKLHKLSSNDWQKTRAKVKKAVKDMADELIALYAKRSKTPGFAFSADCDWQTDFEERFSYTETDDQLRCIEEIKDDMMKPMPMDRLLCGDVGFGKTEVALRGAFKCVLDSKQCAILVPTTVLAWQHYQTTLKRFEHFPVKIQLLSRFRSKKEQEEILKELRRGEIDIIIGTHRLVQKDVQFKDLGLVIIDEEQRFGVAHKEKFKQAFAGVDVLTLSATPIPRTLNMAMSGIRDMSVIEEPPIDRYPVQTYVIEHNMGVIVQALSKELRRGGQVYYIHNRIESIDMTAAKLSQLLPDARIGVAHGQMGEEKLSEIWRQLVEHEIDILVCTTLIETGVDVPNCNTLIIEDADNLGLSQLYQLRGRVGRSNRRAFAYFTFRRGKVLTEIATKRLEAIKEFTQFGSGFRIALRDLEIRGAGSILGGSQHGHMEAVGYDMYLQLLSEAIAEEKGEPVPHRPEECLIDLQIDAHIPDKYIESLSGRIDAYRKIAAIQTKEDSMDIIDEFIDRYGEPPKSIQGLITIALLRNMAGNIGIKEISQQNGIMYFYLTKGTLEQIQAVVAKYKGRVTVNGSEKPFIAVKLQKGDKPLELMQDVVEIMSDIAKQEVK